MRNRLLRDEGGAALVEAALVIPVLLVVVLGLAETCLYLWQRNLVQEAAHLGARLAVVSDAVASGPGLSRDESASYWHGRTPGLRCFDEATVAYRCPTFNVRCTGLSGCSCRGDSCRFTYAPGRMAAILGAMQAVMPELRPEHVEIGYATNHFGYVGRPVPVPVDVTVRLVGLSYEPRLLPGLFAASLPLRAVAMLPGEDLLSN